MKAAVESGDEGLPTMSALPMDIAPHGSVKAEWAPSRLRRSLTTLGSSTLRGSGSRSAVDLTTPTIPAVTRPPLSDLTLGQISASQHIPHSHPLASPSDSTYPFDFLLHRLSRLLDLSLTLSSRFEHDLSPQGCAHAFCELESEMTNQVGMWAGEVGDLVAMGLGEILDVRYTGLTPVSTPADSRRGSRDGDDVVEDKQGFR
jgi:hypothetical protein